MAGFPISSLETVQGKVEIARHFCRCLRRKWDGLFSCRTAVRGTRNGAGTAHSRNGDFGDSPRNHLAEEETVLPAPKPIQERVRFAPLHPEIPAQRRHDFRITDRALGVGSKAEKSMRPMGGDPHPCKGERKKTAGDAGRTGNPFPAMWAGAALPTASMKTQPVCRRAESAAHRGGICRRAGQQA